MLRSAATGDGPDRSLQLANPRRGRSALPHAVLVVSAFALACGANESSPGASGGGPSAGGRATTGGVSSTAGGSSSAGRAQSGGVSSTGGRASSGGKGNAGDSTGGAPATGGAKADGGTSAEGGSAGTTPSPTGSCKPATHSGTAVAAPELVATLFDRWHEAWLGSPAVADLDGDGVNEIIVPRDQLLLLWHLDGKIVQRLEVSGRIWAPPVVADLLPARMGLEVAVASRDQIHAWDAQGQELPGFPVTWRDEMRSLAAADIDGDGELELVAGTTGDLDVGDQTDILIALHNDGRIVKGFLPNTTGASGCDDACYVHAGYDQNVALGDLDQDGIADILLPQDNSYVSLHHGDGVAFDAASIFRNPKFMGVRFLLDYADAKQGYAEDEESANQAHFTNTAPTIADVDGDGKNELVMLSSVQNAAQSDRERGVALWVVNADGTRPPNWVEPFRAPDFIDGLWDAGDNIVGATNQVTVRRALHLEQRRRAGSKNRATRPRRHAGPHGRGHRR